MNRDGELAATSAPISTTRAPIASAGAAQSKPWSAIVEADEQRPPAGRVDGRPKLGLSTVSRLKALDAPARPDGED